MSTAVNLFGPTELAQTQTTIGTTYFGQTETELLKQILVAVANRSGGGGSGAITGEGKLWFTATAPTGWLLCDGAEVSRTTYADLFALIGETYGSGDGSTTFNVPDMTGRVPCGFNATTFAPYDTIGNQIGSETSTVPAPSTSTGSAGDSGNIDTFVQSVYYTPPDNTFSVIQPSLVVNFIIKT